MGIGVLRPGGDGVLAAVGIGSQTLQIGSFQDAPGAAAALAAAGVTRTVHARAGESGWDALAREGREQLGAVVGVGVGWMRMGFALAVVERALPGVAVHCQRVLTQPQARVLDWIERSRPRSQASQVSIETMPLMTYFVRQSFVGGSYQLDPTPLGSIVVAAQRAGHSRHTLLVCGGQVCKAGRTSPIDADGYSVHHDCPWCGGVAYAGDAEVEPVLRRGLCTIGDRCGIKSCAPAHGPGVVSDPQPTDPQT